MTWPDGGGEGESGGGDGDNDGDGDDDGSFSVYSCLLFLISSASVKSIPSLGSENCFWQEVEHSIVNWQAKYFLH